jgi:hypothetical protein
VKSQTLYRIAVGFLFQGDKIVVENCSEQKREKNYTNWVNENRAISISIREHEKI